MSRLATLKAATSLSDMAKLLDFKPKALSYVLYRQPAATKYKTFQIPKRNGGQRTIKAPIDALKLLQRKLSVLLQDCVHEINTDKQRKDRTAHGFKRKRSIITNARQHRHRRWVFNIDLEDFFPARIPVVICEGETDNVYLTHAIRSLAAEFPALAEVMPDQKIRLKVRLYKYPKTSTARLLDLKDGGSGVLSKFIGAYKTETKDFTGPGLTEPVVILYDNDDGAKSIRKTIKSVSNLMPTGAEPFVHVVKNLYAVPTPLGVNATLSKIEDYFDASIKTTVIDGKTFNPDDGFAKDKHYSKKVFAHKVVRPKADTIDFSAFRPLLTNLSAAINKHKASVVP